MDTESRTNMKSHGTIKRVNMAEMALFAAIVVSSQTIAATYSSSKEVHRHNYVFAFRHCLYHPGGERPPDDNNSHEANTDEDMTSGEDEDWVNLYDASTLHGSNFPTQLSHYMTIPLPEWQTPRQWCTETGWNHFHAIGQHILATYLLPPQKEQEQTKEEEHHDIYVNFVVDTASRHVSSAVALTQGMEMAARQQQDLHEEFPNDYTATVQLHFQTTTSPKTSNLSKQENGLQFDHALFHPTSTLATTDNKNNSSKKVLWCEAPSSQDIYSTRLRQVQSIKMPHSLTLPQALDQLQNQTGYGSWSCQSLVYMWNEHYLQSEQGGGSSGGNASNRDAWTPTLNPTLLQVQGPIQLLSMVAEWALHFKASFGATDDANDKRRSSDFLPQLTLSHLMDWLSWSYWLKTVTYIGNVQAATDGVVLISRILQALQQPPPTTTTNPLLDENKDKPRHHHVHVVTIMIGDESMLQSLATAWDMSWELPPPYPDYRYQTRPQWYDTPPGSALYLSLHPQKDDSPSASTENNPVSSSSALLLELRMLAPLFWTRDLHQHWLNVNDQTTSSSGHLASTYIHIPRPRKQENDDSNDVTITIGDKAVYTHVTAADPLAFLQERVKDTAKKYGDIVTQCFQRAQDYDSWNSNHDDSQPPTSVPTTQPIPTPGPSVVESWPSMEPPDSHPWSSTSPQSGDTSTMETVSETNENDVNFDDQTILYHFSLPMLLFLTIVISGLVLLVVWNVRNRWRRGRQLSGTGADGSLYSYDGIGPSGGHESSARRSVSIELT